MLKGSKKSSNTAPSALRSLWQEGFFKFWHPYKEITLVLNKRGNNFSNAELGMSLRRAIYLTRRGKPGVFRYIQKRPCIDTETQKIEQNLFDDRLIKKLDKNFSVELADLHLNFGKSGICSAFLLRKILEKMIYIAFAKNGYEPKLKDSKFPGRLVGLDVMINLASMEKINGIPFIMPKTAQAIKGIKFLGDTSAHNPLSDVDMQTIVPQMPFIITAYKELANQL